MDLRQTTPPRPDIAFRAHVHGGLNGPPCPCCTQPLVWDQLSGGCPDKTPHCLVVHFGFVCPKCMAEFVHDVPEPPKRKEILILGPDDPNQPHSGLIMREKIGIGVRR